MYTLFKCNRMPDCSLPFSSAYLRQSIFLTAYETPEIRSLYNTKLKNVAGKARSDIRSGPVDVPQGIKQVSFQIPPGATYLTHGIQDFSPFHCAGPKDEADQRFKYFTTQVLPGLLKSAVQSANTVIFVPSSFDFIRVHNHFRKQDGVSFAVLSECVLAPASWR